ncbi:hypothetical protein CVS40_7164 [Lucilia cuprina]|nr:hypothetical protein CVS40_7164 [Lucilia cuprina]
MIHKLTFVLIECGDNEAITPNHLLHGSSNGYKPIADGNMDLRQRWYKTQEFADQFWRRWQKSDVVIIVDPVLPRNCWPKGVVVDVAIAKDGQVRRATVKSEKKHSITTSGKVSSIGGWRPFE